MGIVEVKELPKRKKMSRESKYPFSPEEIAQAVAQYNKTGRVGAGPYEGLRAARSASQRFKALVCDAGEIDPETMRTTAWEDDKGSWCALVQREND